MRARDVLGPGSPLAKDLPGYEDRPGQLAMAEAVEEALAHDRPLFVEAGTGTGKTLAYLVPAILSGKKVVVSTATRALQEQIFAKDLPILRSILGAVGIEFRVALMKGLSNYVCKRRLSELLASDGASRLGSDRDLARLVDWAKQTESGDRAELANVAEDSLAWRDVQSSSDTRIGAACAYYDECFVTRMKRDAEEASLVIVNHHLFFADLALRRGKAGEYASAIPPYDAVIFDEAHQIEDIATDFFGVRVSSSRVEALVRDARRALVAVKLLSVLGTGEGKSLLDGITSAATRFFMALGSRSNAAAGEARRVLAERDLEGDVMAAHQALDGALDGLWAYALANDRHEPVSLIARRTSELRTDLRSVLGRNVANRDGEIVEGASHVLWIDLRERSVSLGASPIDLGSTLREALFDRVSDVICTSATLATGNSFHFARARLGAPPHTRELVVPSPFDVAARAALYIPRDLPEPSDPSFEPAAVERIVDLVQVTGGGAFVLCTSTRAMKGFHRALRARLRQTVLVQGE
ncbi:MAG TPA: ATP-dependent DNA helicase, partial [Polyangiaceae bacterium]